jgi:hypothetical protein
LKKSLRAKAGFVFFMGAAFFCGACGASAPHKTGDSVVVLDSFPAAALHFKDAVLVPDRLELMGKLMTLFLKEQKKAYKITRISDSLFALESRNSLAAGSTIRIQQLDTAVFAFIGAIIIKKPVQFPCSIAVTSVYERRNAHIICRTSAAYRTAPVIHTIDKTITAVSGRKYIAYKIADFILRLHTVLSDLETLDSPQWQALARNRALHKKLYFPVTFSQEEIAFVDTLVRQGR